MWDADACVCVNAGGKVMLGVIVDCEKGVHMMEPVAEGEWKVWHNGCWQ
jgi:hypothetical protein